MRYNFWQILCQFQYLNRFCKEQANRDIGQWRIHDQTSKKCWCKVMSRLFYVNTNQCSHILMTKLFSGNYFVFKWFPSPIFPYFQRNLIHHKISTILREVSAALFFLQHSLEFRKLYGLLDLLGNNALQILRNLSLSSAAFFLCLIFHLKILQLFRIKSKTYKKKRKLHKIFICLFSHDF